MLFRSAYNGFAQLPCSAKVTGKDLSLPLTVTTVNPSAGRNVGTVDVKAHYDGDATHNPGDATGKFQITPLALTLTAGSYAGTYDGVAHNIPDCAVVGTQYDNLGCTNSVTMPLHIV